MTVNRSPLAVCQDAAALHRDTAHRVAALIADTLTTMLPNAAYLTFWARIRVQGVLDAQGRLLHRFEDDGRTRTQLPALPEHHRLRAAWSPLDPADPAQFEEAVRLVLGSGIALDNIPNLPHTPATFDPVCLPLAQHTPTPAPAGCPRPVSESALTYMVTAFTPDQIRTGLLAGAELHHTFRDRFQTLCPAQADALTAVADRYPDSECVCPEQPAPAQLRGSAAGPRRGSRAVRPGAAADRRRRSRSGLGAGTSIPGADADATSPRPARQRLLRGRPAAGGLRRALPPGAARRGR